MKFSRSEPRYFTTPSQVRPTAEHPGLSPRLRSVAMVCTATAMLGVVGTLAAVAWVAGRSDQIEQEIASASAADDIRASVVRTQDDAVEDTLHDMQVTGATVVASPPLPHPAVEPATAPQASITADDPRWARHVVASDATVSDVRADLTRAFGAQDDERRVEKSAAWGALRDAPDRAARTAAVIEVATADLEAPAAGSKQADSRPVEAQAAEEVASAVTAAAPSGSAKIRTASNLRSRPANGSKVLGSVPTGAVVQVVSCDIWCEIVHDGRRGFVIGKFVSRGSSKSGQARPQAEAAKPAAPKVVPAGQTAPDTGNPGR